MYLKYLELAGFKSFAKKTKLEFKTPITAIVGPNGSGKSNVAEAFRFALGEQKMTQMRSKRTEDLIWNGSHKVSRANNGRVGLAFDNKKKLFDIDFDEVLLERIIHRDASTEYILNDSSVRLKDIIELLSGAHIGSSGHHIISQGETDRILLVNPKERKGMIEDALGLKVYQYKKLESERKLEHTQQHKKEVESLRREIAPHIKFLRSQVEKLEKTQQMRDELLNLYHKYFAAEEHRLSGLEKENKESSEPIEKELSSVSKELQEAKETLSRLEGKDEKSEQLLLLEKELTDIRKQRGELTREVGQLEGELRARKSVTEAEGARVPVADVLKLKDSLEEKLSEAEQSEDIAHIKSVISGVKERLLSFVRSFAGGESDLENKYQKVLSQKESKEEALREITVTEGKLFSQYDKLREEIESDRDSGREAERSVFTLSTKENDLRSKLDSIMRDEEERVRALEELEHEKEEAVVLVGDTALKKGEQYVFESADDREGMKKNMERLKIRIEDAGTGSGEDIMREYEEVQERDVFLEKELGDLDASTQKLQGLIDDLNTTLDTLFTEGVEKINVKFQELFALMFGGGTASLKVVRENTEDDVVSEGETHDGIEIAVNLPRKKIRGLHMLSGGERALTSIALLFAMSQVNPPPFLVLDETDAALDEANSKRYGDMLAALAKDSQLIVITHNRETMSRAGVLYGVTMGSDGVSQLLSVGFEEAVRVAK